MNARNKIAAGAIASVALLSGAGLFAASAFAQGTGSDTLAAKIASTFHLSQSDVQKVIDQDRQENQAARQAKEQQDQQARLDQAVKDGSLTSAQEALILDKLKSLKPADGATPPTKAAMDQMRSDLEAWAKTNGIDMKWLRPMGGPHRGGKPGPVPSPAAN